MRYGFPDSIRGEYMTRRVIPFKGGLTFAKYQVVALETSTHSLVPYDSQGTDGANVPYAVSLRDVNTASGELYSDYLYNCDWFNGPLLVFANERDTWQGIAEEFRGRRISLRAFNSALDVIPEPDDESESESD